MNERIDIGASMIGMYDSRDLARRLGDAVAVEAITRGMMCDDREALDVARAWQRSIRDRVRYYVPEVTLPADLADRVAGMPRWVISEGEALEGCIIGRADGRPVYLVDVADREPCTYRAWGVLE